MKAIENWIQKTKPNFEKGGKYEKWLPIYESFETFLHVPGNVTLKGSHVRDAIDLKRALIIVIFAFSTRNRRDSCIVKFHHHQFHLIRQSVSAWTITSSN